MAVGLVVVCILAVALVLLSLRGITRPNTGAGQEVSIGAMTRVESVAAAGKADGRPHASAGDAGDGDARDAMERVRKLADPDAQFPDLDAVRAAFNEVSIQQIVTFCRTLIQDPQRDRFPEYVLLLRLACAFPNRGDTEILAYLENERFWAPPKKGGEYMDWESHLQIYGLLGGEKAIELLEKYTEPKYVEDEIERRGGRGRLPKGLSEREIEEVIGGFAYAGLLFSGRDGMADAIIESYRNAVREQCRGLETLSRAPLPHSRRTAMFTTAAMEWARIQLIGFDQYLLEEANLVPWAPIFLFGYHIAFPDLQDECAAYRGM